MRSYAVSGSTARSHEVQVRPFVGVTDSATRSVAGSKFEALQAGDGVRGALDGPLRRGQTRERARHWVRVEREFG